MPVSHATRAVDLLLFEGAVWSKRFLFTPKHPFQARSARAARRLLLRSALDTPTARRQHLTEDSFTVAVHALRQGELFRIGDLDNLPSYHAR